MGDYWQGTLSRKNTRSERLCFSLEQCEGLVFRRKSLAGRKREREKVTALEYTHTHLNHDHQESTISIIESRKSPPSALACFSSLQTSFEDHSSVKSISSRTSITNRIVLSPDETGIDHPLFAVERSHAHLTSLRTTSELSSSGEEWQLLDIYDRRGSDRHSIRSPVSMPTNWWW